MSEKTISYFHGVNTSQRIAGVAFEPVELFAGTMTGVFSTDDPALTETLTKHTNVTVIDKEKYDALLKKKAPALSELRHSNNQPPSPVALKEIVGVVVENPSNAPITGVVAENLLEPRPLETPPPLGRRKK